MKQKNQAGKPKSSDYYIDEYKPPKEYLDKIKAQRLANQPIKLKEIALPLRGKPNAIKEGKNPKGNK